MNDAAKALVGFGVGLGVGAGSVDAAVPDVRAVTQDFELWLGRQIPVVAQDLATKHTEMTDSVLRFLRGTYYLWLERVCAVTPALLAWPGVPIVGDLHVENFGTWHDQSGVRRWGVNDFDELSWGSYALDLVRLVTSAALIENLALPLKDVCRLVLEHWQTGTPGRSIDVDSPAAKHLVRLLPAQASPRSFYRALTAAEPCEVSAVPALVRHAVEHSVQHSVQQGVEKGAQKGVGERGKDVWAPTWYHRQAGTGSLGHPRFLALGKVDGLRVAREAKLLGPPTAQWARERAERADPAAEQGAAGLPLTDAVLYGRAVAAVSGAYPGLRVAGWQVRALAPDIQRIELAGLRARDAQRVVASMAQAMLDVHGVDPAALATARAHGARQPTGWLRAAVEAMVVDTRACHAQWVAGSAAAAQAPAADR